MEDSLLTTRQLLTAVNGKLVGAPKKDDVFFLTVETDSRNVKPKTFCMFVPLVGEFQDGHKYIPDVLEKDASVILLNESEYEKNVQKYEEFARKYPKTFFVRVKNTLHALQDAAECYVCNRFKNMIRVSITGSNGKTTTKEMLVSVCKEHFGAKNVAYTKGNFNSETGLPLSVFRWSGKEKIGIFEMGMNRENEIGEISKILKSEFGIITNIGTAHIGILGSREKIAAEKRKSFDYIQKNGATFVNASDEFADFCTSDVKGEVIKFGRGVWEEKNGVCFLEDKGLYGTLFTVDGIEILLPIPGEYNYINALGVIACAKKLGITAQEIKRGLENFAAVSGRMEIKLVELKNGKKVSVIEDCYNANFDSMSMAIDFCDELKKVGKKIFVLADMKELGNSSKTMHENVGWKLNEVHPDFVFLVGTEMKAAYEILDNKDNALLFECSNEKTFSEIADKICKIAKDGDVILLKGSHSMELEKLVPMLQKESE